MAAAAAAARGEGEKALVYRYIYMYNGGSCVLDKHRKLFFASGIEGYCIYYYYYFIYSYKRNTLLAT